MSPFRRIDLTVVRRYADMNGRFVGELYLDGKMIGASLDNLPLECPPTRLFWLDTRKSFLKAMWPRTLRIGGLEPESDAFTRKLVRSLPSLNMAATFQNNFTGELRPCAKPVGKLLR